jgi:hypothetical protein
MGIVVEYAGAKGEPQWQKPEPFRWDYRRFAKSDDAAAPPDQTITLTIAARIGARDGFDEFTINGAPFSMKAMQPLFRLDLGKRYRLHLRNATDDTHPIHLHRHSFEITGIVGMPAAGVIKDVVMLGGSQAMTLDFTADQPGLSLFHCHMQDHMDSGFIGSARLCLRAFCPWIARAVRPMYGEWQLGVELPHICRSQYPSESARRVDPPPTFVSSRSRL